MSDGFYALLGVAIGLIGAPLTEAVRDRLARKRSERERQASFQKDTLLELQEVMSAYYLDARGMVIHLVLVAEPSEPYVPDSAEGAATSRPRLVVLRTRISDAEAGASVDSFLETATSSFNKAMALRGIKRGIAPILSELEDAFTAANERIGLTLKGLA